MLKQHIYIYCTVYLYIYIHRPFLHVVEPSTPSRPLIPFKTVCFAVLWSLWPISPPRGFSPFIVESEIPQNTLTPKKYLKTEDMFLFREGFVLVCICNTWLHGIIYLYLLSSIIYTEKQMGIPWPINGEGLTVSNLWSLGKFCEPMMWDQSMTQCLKVSLQTCRL